MAMAVQHVHLKGEDPQKTAQFYIDNLGAKLIAEIPGRGCRLDLHGLEHGRPPPPRPPSRGEGQPLHRQSPPGRACARASHARRLGRKAGGGQDQGAPAGWEARADRLWYLIRGRRLRTPPVCLRL